LFSLSVIDGKEYSNHLFTMSLGIGKYSGGGMMQTPNAIADDGLFDITVINKMKRTEVIKNLKLLYNETILSHPKVDGYTGKEISIHSNNLLHIETDGESLGHAPVQFCILPRSIKVIHNKMLN
jgi:diacylglycerol kinase family enzyme